MGRRVMHIDLDAFFVSVEQSFNHALKGKPVIVGGRPDRRGVVAAASYEARAFGVHSAMPLSQAQRLCPQAIFIEGNFQRYRQASEKFMTILADFSPFIEPMGLDEAYLDVTGFESLHGSAVRMAARIKERIKTDIGITATAGIAGSKVVAKIASEAAKPDGLLEIAPGEESRFLAPLAVSKMPGIGKKTEKVLKGLGIDTLGKLAGLPTGALRPRLGIYGEWLRLLAAGIDDRPVEPSGEARSISRETTFEEDSRDTGFLEATLCYLAERVGAGLRRQQRQARCVHIKLRYADFETITRQRCLPGATDADQVIFETGAELLRRALAGERRSVRLIGIGVSNLTGPERQSDLTGSAARQDRLNRAIDSIRHRYGFGAIQSGRTLKLRDIFAEGEGGYHLHTPSLSR